MDQAETDVLAYMSFPTDHRTKIHSNKPIERLNGEIKRRTRLRRLPAEGQVLSQHAGPQGDPLHPRSGSRMRRIGTIEPDLQVP
jgi:hypothetical protein